VTGLAVGLAIGVMLGASIAELAARLRHRREVGSVEVPDEDRDLIEVNFAAHINHLRDEVSDFADRLAGDDQLLRERLRAFERGGQS
jgi:hypothetical protein